MGELLFDVLVQFFFRPFTGFWHRLQDRVRGAWTADWRKVNGRIHMCQAGAAQHLWRANINYSYCFDGEYWSGESWRAFGSQKDADHYAELHPSSSTVVVRVDPGKPEKSVVLAEDQIAVSQSGSI